MNTQSAPYLRLIRFTSIALGLAYGAAAPVVWGTEQLANRSFDTPGGIGWSKDSSWVADPFAIAGEVDLNLANDGRPVKVVWQVLNIDSVGGLAGTASMRMKKTSGPPYGSSISVALDYLDTAGTAKSLQLMAPDNSTVNTPPDGSLISAPFTMPADAKRITGLSVYKNYFGSFQAMEFSLDLPVPVATITGPTNGATLAGGATIPLAAAVDTSGAAISKLEFFANGILIGQGQPGLFGEWSFSDGSHLSVMHADGNDVMIDYNPVGGESMYMMNGSFPSPLFFQGSFLHSPATGGTDSGNAGIDFSYAANQTLSAAIFGMPPLGSRALSGGTNGADSQTFTFAAPGMAAGTYALTARATYGTGKSVTSAPVTITVGAQAPPPTLAIQPTSATEVELSWADGSGSWHLEQQSGLAAGNWTAVSGTPLLTAGRYSLAVSISTPSCFYRLAKP